MQVMFHVEHIPCVENRGLRYAAAGAGRGSREKFLAVCEKKRGRIRV
jgi:hypothetical protein